MSKSKWQTLSKGDVAREQLAAAILLFFDEEPPISAHTLLWCAMEVCKPIALARCGESHLQNLYASPHPDFPMPAAGKKKKKSRDGDDPWVKFVKNPYNFSKHATSDPNESLEFCDMNEALLLLAVSEFKAAFDHINCFAIVVFLHYFAFEHMTGYAKNWRPVEDHYDLEKLSTGERKAKCAKLLRAYNVLPADQLPKLYSQSIDLTRYFSHGIDTSILNTA